MLTFGENARKVIQKLHIVVTIPLSFMVDYNSCEGTIDNQVN